MSDIKNDINYYQQELISSITQKTEKMKMMIKTFNPETLEIRFRSIEQPYLVRLDNAKNALMLGMENRIKETRQFISQSISILEGASPKSILAKGYSMARTQDGKIIRSQVDVSPGETIEIYPAEGMITAQVC